MNSISVFCGSGSGTNIIYQTIASDLGKELAKQKIKLIYGGAKIGLMGSVAEGALQNNGEVIGIIPDFLKTKEVVHDHLSELIIVKTMHERKTKMNELSDGVIALPGGFGTMEEFFEILTWGQLGLHEKPMGLLNINGFYNSLIAMMDGMVKEGFLKEINRNMVLVGENIGELISKMKGYTPPPIDKWITAETT
ncbi:MAG: TIGR00730 family Rossman fold protein [Cyclobacteriaceae bacterium]